MRVSYLELYNEELFDLLAGGDDTQRLRIFEDANRKVSPSFTTLSAFHSFQQSMLLVVNFTTATF